MARSYKRDARGRFAGGGYSGQTGGRGARLTAKGRRAGGGAKMTAARPGGTIGKPRGLKPGAVKVKARAKASKVKTIKQIRQQWDERIAPALSRQRLAADRMLPGAKRQDRIAALLRRERRAGGALLNVLARAGG